MRRFISRILFLLPILAGMILTNWFVDPDHIREPDAYARNIARLLLDGKAVTNIKQPDEAAIMTYYLSNMPDAPDVVVLGSSRVKQLRSDSFPGRTFFNASLSGATLTDYLALTHLMESRGRMPHTLVIELSTHFLSNDVVSVWPRFEVQQKTLEANLFTGQPVPDIPENKQSLETYSRFLSPDYFQLSFFTLLDTRLGDSEGSGIRVFHPGDEPTGLTYLADGSEIFPLQRRKNLGSDSVTALAIEAGQNAAGIPKSLDAERKRVLETYLQSLKDRGVEVILFLGPYHPVSYEIMMGNRNRIVVDIQKYYEELAQRFGFQLVGSYNPADLNLTGDVYFDATHITPEALAGIFAGVK
jgi:hypothetical protein